MSIYGLNPTKCCTNQPQCPDKFGCPPEPFCPTFEIKRHDTKPPFRISVSDCNGPLNLDDCIAEASMWAKGKLKKHLKTTDTYFALANDIGFHQANIGDVIVMDRIRNPEQMLITGFDEEDKLIQVQRGYNGTQVGEYRRGCAMRIFRVLNAVAETHTVTEDIPQVDGTIEVGVVSDSRLVYNWMSQDTCLPGCYWFEFKLLKMLEQSSLMNWLDVTPVTAMADGFCSTCSTISVPSFVPSFIPTVAGCDMAAGVEWVRRFPLEGDGFLVRILDSPTAENVL